MKLFALKLVSLLVFLSSLVVLLLAFGVGQVADGAAVVLPKLVGAGESFALAPLGYLATVILLLLSLYALFPRLGKKDKTLVFPGEHGDVELQLDTVRTTLGKILRNMDEVNTIKISVSPDDDSGKAVIKADVTLNRVPGVSTREATRRVSHYIRHAAGEILGLEDLATIQLNVLGVKLNAKASSRDLNAIPAVAGAAAAVAAGAAEEAEEEAEAAEEEATYEALETPAEETPPMPPAPDTVEPQDEAAPEEEVPSDETQSTETPVLVDTAPVMTPWEEDPVGGGADVPPYTDPMPPAFVTPTPLEPDADQAESAEEETPESAEAYPESPPYGDTEYTPAEAEASTEEEGPDEDEGEATPEGEEEEEAAEAHTDAPSDFAFHAEEDSGTEYELPPLADEESSDTTPADLPEPLPTPDEEPADEASSEEDNRREDAQP